MVNIYTLIYPLTKLKRNLKCYWLIFQEMLHETLLRKLYNIKANVSFYSFMKL